MSSASSDPIDLLIDLIRVPSVTPVAAAALEVLERRLVPAGFSVWRPVFEDAGTAPVENLFAAIGEGKRHLTFAGHVDVVPPGPEERWTHPPFAAEIADGLLYGRGAADMKGGLSAMAAAALRFVARRGSSFGGRISLLVTGDEEGVAVNGTVKLLKWAADRDEHFSAAIVGEPTSAEKLGDRVKIGRRGSFSATLLVEGMQGHAGYPQDAENAIRGLTQLLYALQAKPLDQGSERFEPSSLEIVNIDVSNSAWNVIPGSAAARMNSRFNDLWTRETVKAEVERRLTSAASENTLRAKTPIRWKLLPEPSGSDVYLTHDKHLITTLSGAIEKVMGLRPEISTKGGTSDARFIKDYCPVVDFGPVGRTMHQIDEHVAVADIERAALIYEAFLDAYFA